MKLVDVLRGGRQCDQEGIEIIMSRQACLEAAEEIEMLYDFINTWVYEGNLQTEKSRTMFRKEAKFLLERKGII